MLPSVLLLINWENPWYTCTATCGDTQALADSITIAHGCPPATVDGIEVCYNCLLALPDNFRDALLPAMSNLRDGCKKLGKTTAVDNGPEPTAADDEDDAMPTPSGGTVVVYTPANATATPSAGGVNASTSGGASPSVSPSAKPSSAGTAAGVSIGALVALVATYALL
ncbi:uncharacterized protein LOC62_02G002652 [Vanrija pseudolonga]|uniref:Uncharacterized protein n=1 Tax=Vanrija pseudolonga TaxID=143232 RepID=A0AAF0Y759_9TREE|nr:hypothetical protein LOC62_02G002652 [Vanrija pseudolonga]